MKKRLLIILLILPLILFGQTIIKHFNVLPSSTPDVNTSVVGVKTTGGISTDYIFPYSSFVANDSIRLADSMQVARSLSGSTYPSRDTFNVYSTGASVTIYTATPTANTSYDITGYMNAISFLGNKAVLTVTFQAPATGSTTYRIDSVNSQPIPINCALYCKGIRWHYVYARCGVFGSA